MGRDLPRPLLGLALAALAGLPSCAPRSVETGPARPSTSAAMAEPGTRAIERPVQMLPLAGRASRAEAELSGLAWYGDHLVLLAQFPTRFRSEHDGCFFALPRAEVVAAVDGSRKAPLEPRCVDVVVGSLDERIPGFDGFEAIAFDGDVAVLSVEARVSTGTAGYLVHGKMEGDAARLVIDVSTLMEVVPPVQLHNMAFEALVVREGVVHAFFEVNGRNHIPRPIARRFDLRTLKELPPLSMPGLEYRVTDATSPDPEGRFWVANFFWPGEECLLAPWDPIAETWGKGVTHSRHTTVERLVELQVTAAGVVATHRAPLQLTLRDDERSRNWEGLARLDDRGFLVVSDENPSTLLGFVAAGGAP